MAGTARNMRVRYAPELIKKLKKLNVRIQKAFKESILRFSKNPLDPKLKNHPLRDEWQGYHEIHIGDSKNDWVAIYEELTEDGETIARFFETDTHKNLFDKQIY